MLYVPTGQWAPPRIALASFEGVLSSSHDLAFTPSSWSKLSPIDNELIGFGTPPPVATSAALSLLVAKVDFLLARRTFRHFCL